MAFNHRIDKSKHENSSYENTNEFKMNRVMSAPPQEIADESTIATFISGTEHPSMGSELLGSSLPRSCSGSVSGSSTRLGAIPCGTVSEKSSPAVFDNIPECDSGEDEKPSDFIKFMQIERLIKQFPPLDVDALSTRISAILKIEERTPVEMSFFFVKGEETYLEKIKNLKAKVDSSLEKVRMEFNRVTSGNIASVVENLGQIHIAKIDDMKEVAAFVFEKVISEEVFLEVYVKIIKELHKSWVCEEEKKIKECKQTCFFGTLILLAFKKFESPQNWFADIDQASLTPSGSASFADKVEECYAEKTIKRAHAVGTVRFVVSLYINNIIGAQNVTGMVDKLTSTFTPENVVMLCSIFGPLVSKFLANNRVEPTRKMYEYLKKHSKCASIRLQVEIDKTFAKCEGLVSTLRQGASGTQRSNSFASFAAEEPKIPESPKSDDEILDEFIYNTSLSLDSISDPDDVMEMGDKLFKDIDKFNNMKFVKAYVTEMLSNHKVHPKLLRILLERLLPKAISLPEALSSIKEDLPLLSIDFPHFLKHFSELLCYVRAKGQLTNEEFNKLKPNEFLKRAGSLLKTWRDTKDERLLKVLTEEEISRV